MDLDNRVDAFFARPSRDRLNFEQIEKAVDPIISASRFRRLTAKRSSMTDSDKRACCILDKNPRVYTRIAELNTHIHSQAAASYCCSFSYTRFVLVLGVSAPILTIHVAFCNLCRRGCRIVRKTTRASISVHCGFHRNVCLLLYIVYFSRACARCARGMYVHHANVKLSPCARDDCLTYRDVFLIPRVCKISKMYRGGYTSAAKILTDWSRNCLGRWIYTEDQTDDSIECTHDDIDTRGYLR